MAHWTALAGSGTLQFAARHRRGRPPGGTDGVSPPRDKTRPKGRAGDGMSAEAIAIVGVGVALLAVLVPVVVLQSRRLEQRIDAVVDALTATRTELRTDVAEVRRELHAIAERVARIEGALTGPWRPTNGSPAAASKGSPEATAE